MATNYPGGVDTFNVPSLPEETPLSSAGSASRNHTELHRAIGAAMTAVQTHAAQKGHDHSGDPDDTTRGARLDQANTHENADTDTSASALHHTLGTGPLQAAPGNHLHNYNDLPGAPFKICTSTTRPGAPTQGMVIYETDTKVFRHWETYINNVVVDGLNSTVVFDTASSTTIGGGGWEIEYTLPAGNGRMITPDGSLVWEDGGSSTNVGWARRTDPDDAVTQTDDQVITWMTGDIVIENELPLTDGATNDVYLRVSEDKQSYIRLRIGFNYVKAFYTTSGRENEAHLGTLDNITTNIANCEWQARMVDRSLMLFRTGEHLGTIRDTKNVTSKGANFRGWMIGMQAGHRGFGQTTPAEIMWVRIQDMRRYESTSRWSLLPIGKLPATRLRQAKAQKLIHTGTLVEWNEVLEDTFDFFTPSSPTQVLIKEPGRYQVTAALQWNSQRVPDIANAVLMLNGQETTYRQQQFLRGDAWQPGFSQTLTVTGSMRFAQNDVLSVKVSYTASTGLLDLIFSFFESASQIKSRLDVVYLGP